MRINNSTVIMVLITIKIVLEVQIPCMNEMCLLLIIYFTLS